MKILMLGSGSYKSTLTFRIVALGTELARQGHEVSLMVPSADKYNDFKPDRSATLPGIQLIQPWQLKTRSAMLNLVPYLASSFVALLRRRSDIVYLYKPTPITILGLLPKLLFRTPVILDLDDLGSEVMKAQNQSGLQVRLVALCERLAMRYASAIVVASTYLESIVKTAYPQKPLLVLSNGVTTADYPALKQQNLRNAVYFFGAINTLSLLETTLRALPATLAAVPDTHVYILGGGSALDDVKRLVRELGVASAVTFTGWIDMYKAADYARFADVAICCQPDTPTVRAASNMKVFQYMAMGMVPVVSDVGDLRQYVRDDKAGVVVRPGDAAALADALVTLLKDDTLRKRLALAARELAEHDYAWSQLAGTLGIFITEQISRKRHALAAKGRR